MNKLYIDSNIFLNSILYEDEKAKKCKEIISNIIDKKIIAITSILTWDELVYVATKNLGREIGLSEGEKFLIFPNLTFIDATKNIVVKAQKLIESYNIKPRDALHAATALLQGSNEIISDDIDFDKIKEIKRIKP